ncbi:hypothetical protein KGF54_004434 [Candida jiufengensis]|uniref:uncharacterized protein n=1 Tax=Candida jiufengensis TaxID=497108 RepID=UPI00222465A2|nr:uncharacterized protein KGF54_004434 [Candida jiufengensis]KAI5951360.1 hypothetical protein KGF54_004434 [Candida jiufengensis]
MRSFIKRKNDNNIPHQNDSQNDSNMTSTGVSNLNLVHSNFQPPINYYNSRSTPLSSPKSLNFAQFTPPPSHHSSNTTTNGMGSPKKLLTPIKNLFSSNKSTTSSPSSNDNLQDILQSNSNTPNKYSPKDSKTSRFRKHIRSKSNNNISSLNDFKKLPEDLPPAPNTYKIVQPSMSSPSLHDLQLFNTSKSQAQQQSQYQRPHQSKQQPTNARSQTYQNLTNTSQEPIFSVKVPINLEPSNNLGPPIDLSNDNFSNISLPESKNNFYTKDVCFDPALNSSIEDKEEFKTDHTSYSNESQNDDHEEEDEEEEEEDNTSQFSFVQDMKNGRNTSVKYYKTKNDSTTKAISNNKIVQSTFDEQDLGYEDEELSDYDFENNGECVDDMEDYDYDDEFQGGNNAYDDMFNDNDKSFNDQDEDLTPKQLVFDDEVVQHQDEGPDYYELSRIEEEEEISKLYFTNEPLVKLTEPPVSSDSKFEEFIKNRSFPPNKVFNASHHLSIQGTSLNSSTISSPKCSDLEEEEDILENYLESDSTTTTKNNQNQRNNSTINSFISPNLDQSETFELFSSSKLNSPLINGVTIGNNLRHRNKSNDNNRSLINRDPIVIQNKEERIVSNERIASFHQSFDEKLNFKIGEKVEEFDNWQKEIFKKEKFNNNVKASNDSIKDNGIWSQDHSTKKEDSINRESILGMMNFLNSVEDQSIINQKQSPKTEIENKDVENDSNKLNRFDSILSRNSSNRSYMQQHNHKNVPYNPKFARSEFNLNHELSGECLEMRKKSLKRYSWFSDSEEISLKNLGGLNKSENSFVKTKELINENDEEMNQELVFNNNDFVSLNNDYDQDHVDKLLDEINEMPNDEY